MRFISIRLKLLLLLMGVSIVAIGTVLATASLIGQREIQAMVLKNLDAVRSAKAYHVRSYLDQKRQDVLFLAGDPSTRDSLRLLQTSGNQLGALRRGMLPRYQLAAERLGLNDILLIDAQASRVLFSVRQNRDLGATLTSPAFRETNLAEVVRASLAKRGSDRTAIADFEAYPPVGDQPVAFMSAPILQDGKVVGVLAARLSIDEINRVMTSTRSWTTDGLGDTGETFLVGPDMTMRNDSRSFIEDADAFFRTSLRSAHSSVLPNIKRSNTTVLLQPVETVAAKRAIAGAEGVLVGKNYRDLDVLTAYGPLAFAGLRWGILCEMSTDEAFAPVASFRRSALISSVVALGLVVIVSMLTSRRLVAPIVELNEKAHAFGHGERGVRASAKSRDEVGELGRTFNAMVESLERMDSISHSIRRNIVHDLKTPVTVIKGVAQTLLAPGVGDDPELREELVGNVLEQSDRLMEDLRDILTPVDASYAPQAEKFDLAMLVQKVVQAERHTTRSAGKRFELIGTDAPLEVYADQRKIRRVVENLLSNAVKYSPGSAEPIRVEVAEDLDRIEVTVTDRGIGLSETDLERVLESGGRVVDESLGIEGSGFGLDSCRRVLEAHGGSLAARSKLGEGSSFTAILPRHSMTR